MTRYAALNSLMLSTYGIECLDINYSAMINQLKDTSWDDEAVAGMRLDIFIFCLSVHLYICVSAAVCLFVHLPNCLSIDC